MILAKHLMVGNLFTDDQNEILKIDLIDSIEETVNANGMENISISDLIPLPLTEDILLKCGFEWSDGEHKTHCQINMDEDRKLTIYFKDGVINQTQLYDEMNQVYNGMFFFNPIQYLHQLQNLYFALTQKELTVQL